MHRDKLQKLRMERERKREDERLKQQQELEISAKQREAADKQRKLEAERLKQIEARRQTEAAEQRRQLEAAERKKQVEAEQREFRAGQLATLSDKYQLAIQSVVTQNWLRPAHRTSRIEMYAENCPDSRWRGYFRCHCRQMQRRPGDSPIHRGGG